MPGRVRTDRRNELGLAGLGLALCAMAAAVTASGSSSQYAWLEALGRGISVGVPIAVGLYARRRVPFRRFGTLLLATGVLISIATLAEPRRRRSTPSGVSRTGSSSRCSSI